MMKVLSHNSQKIHSLEGDKLPHGGLEVKSRTENVSQIGRDIRPSSVFQHLFRHLVGVLVDGLLNVCHDIGNLHLEWILCGPC